VVGHEVEEQLESPAVYVGQQRIEVGHRAEKRMDAAVVGDIIAKVVHRRRKDGREPDSLHVEALDIVEPAANAREVAHAVGVAVHEGTRVDLVDDPGLPP